MNSIKPKRCSLCGAESEDLILIKTEKSNRPGRVIQHVFCNDCLDEFTFERPFIKWLDTPPEELFLD